MRFLSSVLLILMLGGCALSPQFVEIHPAPEIPDGFPGKNAALYLQIIDERDDKIIGTRGGVYPETSLIRAAEPLTETLRTNVTRSLRQLGYVTVDADDAPTFLNLHIDELSYQPKDGAMVSEVRITARLRAVAMRDEVTHTSRYQSSVTHNQPVSPTARRNERWLNEILARTLERMLNDEQLLAFLAGGDVE